MAYQPLTTEIDTVYTLTSGDGRSVAVFNDPTSPNYVGALTEITGLDSAEIRESAQDMVEADGGAHGAFYLGRRPISVNGRVFGHATVVERGLRLDRARRASLALRDDSLLEWTTAEGVGVFIPVRRQQPFRESGAWVKDFQIPLVSELAVIQSSDLVTVGAGVATENLGNYPSFPVVEITGPSTDPTVTSDSWIPGIGYKTYATTGPIGDALLFLSMLDNQTGMTDLSTNAYQTTATSGFSIGEYEGSPLADATHSTEFDGTAIVKGFAPYAEKDGELFGTDSVIADWGNSFGAPGAGQTDTVAKTFKVTHRIVAQATTVRFVYGNFNSEDLGANDITVKAAIESGASIIPLYFNGVRTVTIEPGEFVLSDPISIFLAKNATINSRTYVAPASGGTYPVDFVDEIKVATGDFADSGTVNGAANDAYSPVAIIGASAMQKYTIGLMGDSVLQGDNYIYHAFPDYGTINMGAGGSRYDIRIDPDKPSQHEFNLLAETDQVVSDLPGINDVRNLGNLAQLQKRAIQMAAYLYFIGVRKVHFTTAAPTTYSGDVYTTTKFQNSQLIPTSEAARLAYNAWLLTDPSPLIESVIDVAGSVQELSVRTNLCLNPSFETNNNNWALAAPSFAASAWATSTTWAKTQTSSGRITATKDATATSRNFILTHSGTGLSGAPVTGSVPYTFSAWLNVVDAPSNSLFLRMIFYDSGGTQIGSAFNGTSDITTGVKRYSVTATAPSNAAFVACALVGTSAVSGDTSDIYMDAVLIEQTGTLLPFFGGNGYINVNDGLYVDDSTHIMCSWQGTTNLSKSTFSQYVWTPGLTDDGTHPNFTGYDAVADDIEAINFLPDAPPIANLVSRENLATNPNIAVNVDDHSSISLVTFERDSNLPTQAGLPDGLTTAIHAVADATSDKHRFSAPVVSGETYLYSYFLRIEDINAGGNIFGYTDDGTTTKSWGFPITDTGGEFIKVGVPFTADSTGTWRFGVSLDGTSAEWHATGFRVEKASQHIVDGHFPLPDQITSGEAKWTGTANDSSSRIGSHHLFAIWAQRAAAGDHDGLFDTGSENFEFFWTSVDGLFLTDTHGDDAVAGSWNPAPETGVGDFHFYVLDLDLLNETVEAYIDGVSLGSKAITADFAGRAEEFRIGPAFNGPISGAAVYNALGWDTTEVEDTAQGFMGASVLAPTEGDSFTFVTDALTLASGEVVEFDLLNHTGEFTAGARVGQQANKYIDFSTTQWPYLAGIGTYEEFSLSGGGVLVVRYRHTWA